MTEFSDLNLCPINNRQGIYIVSFPDDEAD